MTKTISDLRSDIDAIDDKLAALLNERARLVTKVGAIKKASQVKGHSFIRAGREAQMLRRMLGAFKGGAFTPAAAAQMWRIIISASLALESPLTVAAFAPDAHNEIYWHAREYFGNFTPTTRKPTAKSVLNDVRSGKAQVGVLPLPDASPEGQWWLTLPEDIKIFACIPFVLPKGGAITALAVAKVEPEDTSNDMSLFSDGKRLLEVKGFVTAHKSASRWLGAYALPVTL